MSCVVKNKRYLLQMQYTLSESEIKDAPSLYIFKKQG